MLLFFDAHHECQDGLKEEVKECRDLPLVGFMHERKQTLNKLQPGR